MRGVLLQIGEVGRDDIDAQQFGVGEHHPGVHDDDVVAVADGHGVHPELAQAAERDDLEFFIGQVSSVTTFTRTSRRWRSALSKQLPTLLAGNFAAQVAGNGRPELVGVDGLG